MDSRISSKKSENHEKNRLSCKTIFLVGNVDHPKSETITLMVDLTSRGLGIVCILGYKAESLRDNLGSLKK